MIGFQNPEKGTTRPTWEGCGCGGGESAKLQHSNWRGGEYIDGGDDNGDDGESDDFDWRFTQTRRIPKLEHSKRRWGDAGDD